MFIERLLTLTSPTSKANLGGLIPKEYRAAWIGPGESPGVSISVGANCPRFSLVLSCKLHLYHGAQMDILLMVRVL